MLKAKAKAAATAAKQKKLAAERAATAAAAAAAAAQHAQASQAIPNPVVGTRSGAGGRPSVTRELADWRGAIGGIAELMSFLNVPEYWVDNQSSMLSSGGGIQRIGYDQAAFEDGVRNVILDPEPASFDKTAAAGEGEQEEKKAEAATTTTESTREGKKADGGAEDKVELQVDEELVAILVRFSRHSNLGCGSGSFAILNPMLSTSQTQEFDLTPKAATALLQNHQNDLSSTIEALLTPPSHPSAPSGRPASKLVSVSN